MDLRLCPQRTPTAIAHITLFRKPPSTTSDKQRRITRLGYYLRAFGAICHAPLSLSAASIANRLRLKDYQLSVAARVDLYLFRSGAIGGRILCRVFAETIRSRVNLLSYTS